MLDINFDNLYAEQKSIIMQRHYSKAVHSKSYIDRALLENASYPFYVI